MICYAGRSWKRRRFTVGFYCVWTSLEPKVFSFKKGFLNIETQNSNMTEDEQNILFTKNEVV